jgi:hypothetical protein
VVHEKSPVELTSPCSSFKFHRTKSKLLWSKTIAGTSTAARQLRNGRLLEDSRFASKHGWDNR